MPVGAHDIDSLTGDLEVRPANEADVQNPENDLDGDVVRNVVFTNGCNGNLKAIGKLVEGMTVDEIEGVLKGNTCREKPTSCADQLARAVRKAAEAAE